MKLNFVKVNPVENMTIFIMDQIPRTDHKDLSNKIMNYNNLHGEQVGFIEAAEENKDLIRLQMMGGEFCGNATRSLAALMVDKGYPQVVEKDNKYLVDIEVSGMAKAVSCQVEKLADNKYLSKIEMEPPLSVDEIVVPFEDEDLEVIRVNFDGIVHFIVDRKKIKDKDGFYRRTKESLASSYYEAFGIMYYDFEENFMEPLVYVRATDSLFWERSCASGTCSLGAALAYLNEEDVVKEVRQPGGSLSVEVEYKNSNISKIYLNGEVEIVAEGILYI